MAIAGATAAQRSRIAAAHPRIRREVGAPGFGAAAEHQVAAMRKEVGRLRQLVALHEEGVDPGVVHHHHLAPSRSDRRSGTSSRAASPVQLTAIGAASNASASEPTGWTASSPAACRTRSTR